MKSLGFAFAAEYLHILRAGPAIRLGAVDDDVVEAISVVDQLFQYLLTFDFIDKVIVNFLLLADSLAFGCDTLGECENNHFDPGCVHGSSPAIFLGPDSDTVMVSVYP
jgi:hypothetical protein